MRKMLPLIGLILLLALAASAQDKKDAGGPAPALPADKSATTAPVAADSELLLIFQAHRVTNQLIEEKLKTLGIPELQQELRVLQARFEAWKKAKGVPATWIWNDAAKQFEPPAAPSSSPETKKPL